MEYLAFGFAGMSLIINCRAKYTQFCKLVKDVYRFAVFWPTMNLAEIDM